MSLETFIKGDMGDFLDMISNAIIERNARTEEEIKRVIDERLEDEINRTMRQGGSFFGKNAGKSQGGSSASANGGTSGAAASLQTQADEISDALKSQVEAMGKKLGEHLLQSFSQATDFKAPELTTLPPKQEFVEGKAQESSEKTDVTQNNIPVKDILAKAPTPEEHKVEQEPKKKEEGKKKQFLPQPGVKGVNYEDPNLNSDSTQINSPSLGEEHKHLHNLDLPIDNDDDSTKKHDDESYTSPLSKVKESEKSSLFPTQHTGGSGSHNKRREELTRLAHIDTDIKEVKRLIKEKRYGRANELIASLMQEAKAMQYHQYHRRKLLDILVNLEHKVKEKQELIRPIKVHEFPKIDPVTKKPYHVFRIHHKKHKHKSQDSNEIDNSIYPAKKEIKQVQEERYQRFHFAMYKEAIHALRHEDWNKATSLFKQLVMQRPNNNAYKIRLQQAMSHQHE